VALLLRRRGIARVRPLAGGFLGWREAGFPLEGAGPSPAGAGLSS
jgi:rhodanese-related sulfurtransferase